VDVDASRVFFFDFSVKKRYQSRADASVINKEHICTLY
jgi:hypothetical protein